MGRVILHCDANSFYASCELCYKPWLKDKPVAVGGDQEARHGIVLTANPIAKKKYGIKTGEVLWEARQKCPQITIFPADYPLYVHFSRMMREIEEEYSDQVEAFGLDENWIDLSAWNQTLDQGEKIAQEIRTRIKDELGITVSMARDDIEYAASMAPALFEDEKQLRLEDRALAVQLGFIQDEAEPVLDAEEIRKKLGMRPAQIKSWLDTIQEGYLLDAICDVAATMDLPASKLQLLQDRMPEREFLKTE